jgi:hypothetical protein
VLPVVPEVPEVPEVPDVPDVPEVVLEVEVEEGVAFVSLEVVGPVTGVELAVVEPAVVALMPVDSLVLDVGLVDPVAPWVPVAGELVDPVASTLVVGAASLRPMASLHAPSSSSAELPSR